MLVDKIVEDTTTTILDEVKDQVDETDFKAIADGVLNKLEELFKEGGLADKVVEMITERIRGRFDIEDSNPDN